ncbi:hypothetical protein D0869_13407 [Hortaea werneckii]|uniref:DUF7730 domain-containing protein n=1 Tax=Hortaea werneckii TaxID=91943 RepID=A0A3M6W5X4_HORWE|nr:hypothetical protein KC316_g13061 [Hortaea werneckii]RMX73630.1 hypothetical protein D0869_13407 [Hortaea werneckii]RMX96039.1 hypothetical protein D0868_11397 [Hortaea werneckii]
MSRREAFDNVPYATKAKAEVACHFNQSQPNGTYQDPERCFTHDIHLKSLSAFRLEPIMIEHGQYKGLKAVVLAPTTTFPFEKLPPELRQMVYERVFCRSCTTTVSAGKEIGELNWQRSSNNHTTGQLAKRQGVHPLLPRPEPRFMSLLMTNKLIYTEARPFLYDGHDFDFYSMALFNSFVQKLGTSARFLKSALVAKGGVTRTARCYTLLNQLEKLQNITVTFPVRPVDHFFAHVEKHWEHAKLFLLSAGVDEEESKRRLGLITFRVGPTQRNVLGSDGKVIKVITAEMNEVCKRYLMKKIKRHFQAETETIRV